MTKINVTHIETTYTPLWLYGPLAGRHVVSIWEWKETPVLPDLDYYDFETGEDGYE